MLARKSSMLKMRYICDVNDPRCKRLQRHCNACKSKRSKQGCILPKITATKTHTQVNNHMQMAHTTRQFEKSKLYCACKFKYVSLGSPFWGGGGGQGGGGGCNGSLPSACWPAACALMPHTSSTDFCRVLHLQPLSKHQGEGNRQQTCACPVLGS